LIRVQVQPREYRLGHVAAGKHDGFAVCYKPRVNDEAVFGNPQKLIDTCTTCHDAPNAGNHSVVAPLNIGLVDEVRRTQRHRCRGRAGRKHTTPGASYW